MSRPLTTIMAEALTSLPVDDPSMIAHEQGRLLAAVICRADTLIENKGLPVLLELALTVKNDVAAGVVGFITDRVLRAAA